MKLWLETNKKEDGCIDLWFGIIVVVERTGSSQKATGVNVIGGTRSQLFKRVPQVGDCGVPGGPTSKSLSTSCIFHLHQANQNEYYGV